MAAPGAQHGEDPGGPDLVRDLTGTVSVVRAQFGFIKSPEHGTDVFFHVDAVEAPAGSGSGAGGGSGGDAAAGAAAPASGDPPPPGSSGWQQHALRVGDAVDFRLAPESRPGKPVAARVARARGGARGGAAPPAPRGARRVGVVATPATPAGNAAWAAALRNGLVRFLDDDGAGAAGAPAVRHVAFGTADVAAGGGVLAAGTPVLFDLVERPAPRRAAVAAVDERAAFFAAHAAARVAPLGAGGEAALDPPQRRALAVLALLSEVDAAAAAQGPPPPR